MIAGFLNRIFPRKPSTSLGVFAWTAFFLLFPVAFIAGSVLAHRELHSTLAGMSTDRGSAIATARQFLADRGYDVTSWRAYASVEPSSGLMNYYRVHTGNDAKAAQAFSLAVPASVLLMSDSGELAKVTLDHNGRLVDFDLTHVKAATTGSGAALPLDQATAVATDAV